MVLIRKALKANRQIVVTDIFKLHDYELELNESEENHEALNAAPGINSSMFNSFHLWHKSGQVYIFDKWNNNRNGIIIIDVTRILEGV